MLLTHAGQTTQIRSVGTHVLTGTLDTGVGGRGRWRFSSPQGIVRPRQGSATQAELLNEGGQGVETQATTELAKKENRQEMEALRDPSKCGIGGYTEPQLQVALRCLHDL